MHAHLDTPRNPSTQAARSGGLLLGFGTFFRKEIQWWWSSRAALSVLAVATVLGGLSVVAVRLVLVITKAVGEPMPAGAISLDPTINVLGAQWDQWLILVTIFVSMGMLTTERDRGTLAWSLSKPLSRTSLLLAKWSAGVLMIGTFGLALPILVGTAAAVIAYGGMPDVGRVATLSALLMTVPALFLALTLCAGTRLGNQAGIAALAFGVAAIPLLIGPFLRGFAELWPTSIGAWSTAVATGQSASVMTPVVWALVTLVVAVVAADQFGRRDL